MAPRAWWLGCAPIRAGIMDLVADPGETKRVQVQAQAVDGAVVLTATAAWHVAQLLRGVAEGRGPTRVIAPPLRPGPRLLDALRRRRPARPTPGSTALLRHLDA